GSLIIGAWQTVLFHGEEKVSWMNRFPFQIRLTLFLISWLLVNSHISDGQELKNLRRERAIKALEGVGAVITYATDDRTKPIELSFAENRVTDKEMPHLLWLTTLESVDFNSAPSVTSQGFAFLRFLPNLRTLNLGGTDIKDKDLNVIRSLKKLETLHLWLTDIGDPALDPIADHPKLQTLNLWDAELSDAGIAKLAGCKTLRRLYIGRTIDRPILNLDPVLDNPVLDNETHIAAVPRISDAGVAALQAELPQTKIFYFNAQSRQIPDEGEAVGGVEIDAAEIRARIRRVSEPAVPNIAKRRGGHDWASFLGPTRDNKSAETNIVMRWPDAGPRIVWQRKMGDSHGTCAVYRGRLLLMERVGEINQLLCLHSETGRELWAFKTPTQYVDQVGYGNGPRCSPVVDGNRVYAYQADGVLNCVSVTEGKLLWSIDTAQEFGVVQYFFGVGSTPTVEGDMLFVAVGGSPQKQSERQIHMDSLKGNGTGIVAFNKYTGEIVYGITSALASYASPTFATIEGRRWGFVFARGELIGFDPRNGKVDFQFPWKARFKAAVSAATPIVVGDEVFISEAYGPGSCLLKVRPGGYEVVWQDDLRSREKSLRLHWNTPIYHNGFLYACSGRHAVEGEIRCVDWKTGAVMWKAAGINRSSLLFADDHFIALGEYGELLVFKANDEMLEQVCSVVLKEEDLEDGDSKDGDSKDGNAAKDDAAEMDLPRLLKYPAWSAPVLSHGLLYVRGKDRFVCLDLNKPDLNKPDLKKLDLKKLDLKKLDLKKPDLNKPDLNKPDLNKPDLKKPDLNKPDLKGSD
ncbi:MAG: outer membrane protein assembly factor BamB, partial [Pirellulaceae bacterium]